MGGARREADGSASYTNQKARMVTATANVIKVILQLIWQEVYCTSK
jgi:hypothetical protein